MRNIFQKMHAVHLRQQGKSLAEIQAITKIPRSTLSDWFKKIHLTEPVRALIDEKKKQANSKARHQAILTKKANFIRLLP